MYGIVTRKGIGGLLNVWYCHQEGYWGPSRMHGIVTRKGIGDPLECMVLSLSLKMLIKLISSILVNEYSCMSVNILPLFTLISENTIKIII